MAHVHLPIAAQGSRAALDGKLSEHDDALNALETGPVGAAGGDLAGTYPNPTLTTELVSAPAALSGAGTLDVTKRTTLFTSTGAAQAVVLPDGTRAGQRHTVIMSVDGGSGVITPTHAGNFATATLTNKWDWFEFEWSGTHWNAVGGGIAPAGLA